MFENVNNIVIQEIPNGEPICITFNDNGVITKLPEFLNGYKLTSPILANKIIYAVYTDKILVNDIFDIITGTYMTQHDIFDTCIQLGLPCVTVKYNGKFKSMNHCTSFLRKVADNVRAIWIKQDEPVEERETRCYIIRDNIINLEAVRHD